MRTLFSGLLLLMSLPAMATTFHVDPVNGSDSGDGSSAHPWKSLQTVFASGLVETQNWPSYPYQTGMSLVTLNAGAPVRAGDTILLGNGYHGDLVIEHAYNTAAITIANESGQTPQFRSIVIRSAQNWILRGLRISPSFAPSNVQLTMVSIANHNYFGPTWDIELADSELFSVADASAWTASEWINLASNGIDVGADRISVHDNTLRNVRFGISVDGAQASIRHNLIDGFSADGMRGLGDHGLFEYNRVQNVKIGDPPDANHDDGFQSWSVGSGGVGTGEVVGVVLRGNVFVSSTDPNDPLRNSMQGIGCFDGFFRNWVVENNIVITDHWHGISFYGMTDSRIINNTVIDVNNVSPGPPWIMVHAHKDGRPSSNVIVRNNLATDFSLDGNALVVDHNLEMSNPGSVLVAPPYDVHLLPTGTAIDSGNATLAPPFDIDGVPRPQGAGFDLGAYEWRVDLLFADGFEGN
ncbi:MAG TPA: choice-of-anchor Q domain-containing protein [Dokdonella sp.]|uniref:choice-of-anchor Q domain-containing protein n=1 Tax=Dokdonella sp. TaxID=2291710 RepID=UPI002D7E3813|nr:choice-of-anchor Q domain-containing protein [Dokdonella sp.]HET9033175.1 choice-of-anchor Q domain-containing protein [Dokdonella sp.]